MDLITHRDAIDRACREMTDADLSPAFRAQVMARLGPAPARVTRRPLAPIAAVCTLVAAVAGMWLQGVVRVEFAHVGAPAAEVSRVTAISAPAQDSVDSPTRPRAVPLSADELGWLARALPPLAEAPAIAIEPIQPSRPVIAPISVDALGVDTFELAPLEMRSSGRD